MSDRSPYSPENMRKRFDELTAKKAEIEARTMPLKASRDKILQEADAAARAIAEQFKAIEKAENLYEIDMERGRIARALGGRSMSGR